MFVARCTTNPESDVARGWSAWGGVYVRHPLDHGSVENAMLDRGYDEETVINAIADEYTHQTDEGWWELVDSPEALEAIAEWCRDELDIDIQRCPVLGLYAHCHHEGISCYELEAETLQEAIAEAEHLQASWTTGGVTGLRPTAYFPTSRTASEDIYVFEVAECGAQMDS